jgi:hypothetical protein
MKSATYTLAKISYRGIKLVAFGLMHGQSASSSSFATETAVLDFR